MIPYPHDYASAARAWARSRVDRPRVDRNTYLVRIPRGMQAPAFGIQLHSTVIVRWDPDGSTVLDTGGWDTVTTADRMRSSGIRLGIGNAIWDVRGYVLVDGMRILADGSIVGHGGDDADRGRRERVSEQRRERYRREKRERERRAELAESEHHKARARWLALSVAERFARCLEGYSVPDGCAINDQVDTDPRCATCGRLFVGGGCPVHESVQPLAVRPSPLLGGAR